MTVAQGGARTRNLANGLPCSSQLNYQGGRLISPTLISPTFILPTLISPTFISPTLILPTKDRFVSFHLLNT